jgi:hypothetical protein
VTRTVTAPRPPGPCGSVAACRSTGRLPGLPGAALPGTLAPGARWRWGRDGYAAVPVTSTVTVTVPVTPGWPPPAAGAAAVAGPSGPRGGRAAGAGPRPWPLRPVGGRGRFQVPGHDGI